MNGLSLIKTQSVIHGKKKIFYKFITQTPGKKKAATLKIKHDKTVASSEYKKKEHDSASNCEKKRVSIRQEISKEFG